MVNFLLKKISYSFLVIFGVLTIVFFLFNVLPGDPARMMLDKREDSKQLEIIKKKYGFDKPIFTQYLFYLNDLSIVSIHSNNLNSFTFLDDKKYSFSKILDINNYSIVLKKPYLRTSFVKSNLKVSTIIKSTFPNTFLLAFLAILFGLIFAFRAFISSPSDTTSAPDPSLPNSDIRETFELDLTEKQIIGLTFLK